MGSTLRISYHADGWCLEVYSLRQVVERFRGGWKGSERYPVERNMEGMIGTLAQMASDALQRSVKATAQRKVQSVYPDAWCRYGNVVEVLAYIDGEIQTVATGTNESQAWRNAAKAIASWDEG